MLELGPAPAFVRRPVGWLLGKALVVRRSGVEGWASLGVPLVERRRRLALDGMTGSGFGIWIRIRAQNGVRAGQTGDRRISSL